MPQRSKAQVRKFTAALVAAFVFLVAFPLAFGAHLPVLGIVFVVLFVLSLVAVVVIVARVLGQTKTDLDQAMREEAEIKNRRING